MRRGTYCRTMSENYCVLDLETTGLSPYENEIIEIAMLRVRGGSVQQIFQTLVHPEHRISRFITNLTGISNEMVETSPAIEDVIGDAFQFLGEDLIVGHNVSFDLRFLSAAWGKDFDNPYADTMQLSRKLFSCESYSLENLKAQFDIHCVSHRAQSDCEATQILYELIRKKVREENICL